MKKKLQIFLFLSLTITLVTGQTITLFNETNNQVASKIVYIGIENRFQVKEYKSLAGIEAINYITLVKDNLIIRPATPGKLPVKFITNNGKAEIIEFLVRDIPNPIITVGDNTVASIAKSNLANNSILSIKSESINESFFEGYHIEYFEAEINGENFTTNGNQISEQLLGAIQKSKIGAKLTFSSINMYNKKLETHIKMNGGFMFVVK